MPQDAIVARLQRPLVDSEPPNTFRLGIVLNGTVAAGAWTAGVLDMLMEALDAWEAAKVNDPDIPQHTVRLDVMGGASGGGVCAAILARAASRHFPHVQSEAGDLANPFWKVWVETLDIAQMLDLDDLAAPTAPAAALLNGKAIRLAADAILKWGTATAGVSALPHRRAWLADPFHVLVTLTNLRGVPYAIDFDPAADGAPRSSFYVDHADHALFAFPAGLDTPVSTIRPDELRIDNDFAAAQVAWSNFGEFVKATGAFPVGFPPLRLSRPSAHYNWRAAMLPGGTRGGKLQPAEARRLVPAWSVLPEAERPDVTYVFDCVDGGACNNQPVELVRAALAGLGGTLERDAKSATAAVLLIDPFAAAPDCPAPTAPPGLFDVAKGLGNAWKDQARFASADLLLALDPTVFSRFLLTAGRTDANNAKVWGGNAIAGSGLGAFLGFLDRRYRVHDYMLGRKNCQDWLARHFVLDQDNPIFAGFGSRPAADDFRPAPGSRMLPIIPLVPPLRSEVPQPKWPMIDPATDALEHLLKTRLEAVATRLGGQSKIPCSGPLADLLGSWLASYARQAIGAAAQAQQKKA